MNYEDVHPDSPEDKILYHYRIQEVETSEPFGDQISFYLLELPRIMHYTDEYDSPVADGAEYSGISLSLPSRGRRMMNGLANWRKRCVSVALTTMRLTTISVLC